MSDTKRDAQGIARANKQLSRGYDFPYDIADNGRRKRKRTWSERAALGVLADLTDRRGIRGGLANIDEGIRKEIVQSLASIIQAAAEQDD